MIYSGLEVIDGDTIRLRFWPFGLSENCRIEGLDCDEMDTTRGKRQRAIAESFMYCNVFKPYIFGRYGARQSTKWRFKKRCSLGRLIVRVYVWDKYRYRDYSQMMIENGDVKKGSKWNE